MIDPRLKLAYTDAKEREYFTFTSLQETPWKRFMAANVADFFLKKGLPDAFLTKVIDLGKAICFDAKKTPEQRLQDTFAIWQNIEMRKGYVCSEDQYLRMAAIYFVIEGEPLDEVYETWTQKKLQLWEEDPTAKDFFCQKAFGATMNLIDISVSDMKDYLNIAREREMNIPTLPEVSETT